MPAKKFTYLLLLTLFSVNLLSCKAQMPTYEWLPTECAPKGYPVEILKGDFLFENGSALYMPDGQLVHNGWGIFGSTHIVGDPLKPLPKRLAITWMSFAEDKFYNGDFELPHEKLSKLFEDGYTSPLTGEHKTWDKILVGMAPGGGVAVWVMGDQVTEELCFLQAKETTIEWGTFIDNPDYPRKRYVQMQMEQALGSTGLQTLRKEAGPLTRWSKQYRTLYNWNPVPLSQATVTAIAIQYYNGEREYLQNAAITIPAPAGRPAPKSSSVWWTAGNGAKWGAEILFDDGEIFAAFAKMASSGAGAPLKLQIRISESGPAVKVLLSNEQTILELVRGSARVFPG